MFHSLWRHLSANPVPDCCLLPIPDILHRKHQALRLFFYKTPEASFMVFHKINSNLPGNQRKICSSVFPEGFLILPPHSPTGRFWLLEYSGFVKQFLFIAVFYIIFIRLPIRGFYICSILQSRLKTCKKTFIDFLVIFIFIFTSSSPVQILTTTYRRIPKKVGSRNYRN